MKAIYFCLFLLMLWAAGNVLVAQYSVLFPDRGDYNPETDPEKRAAMKEKYWKKTFPELKKESDKIWGTEENKN